MLDEDLPALHDEDEQVKSGVEGMADESNEVEMDQEASPDALGQLWEDEDTKSFYESLVDLQEIVPAILYKDSKTQELPKIGTISISHELWKVSNFYHNICSM